METIEQDCVRLGSRGNGKIEINGLAREEEEKVEGAIRGFNWIRVDENGRIVSVPATNPLPAPTDDPEMLPFWRPYDPYKNGIQTTLKLFTSEQDFKHYSSGSITIEALCGYGYTPEGYKEQAERLESYGFKCLRSQRSEDGLYWELWYLPGLWSASGALHEALNLAEEEGKEEKTIFESFHRKLEIAIEFLRRHVSFGSLDVTVQRLAATID